MLRSVNRECIKRNNYFRVFSTAPVPKEAHTIDPTEWNKALPYSQIPGPTAFQLLRNFLPGGKYYKASILELQRKLREEYGSLTKMPSLFGRPVIVMSFDPNDFERVFRTEGIWPRRRALETFVHYRKEIRPDVFKNMGGLLTEDGEAWGKLRSKVNPVMLQPKSVKSYIPQVDEIAREFVERTQLSRDKNNEVPASFGHELNKWALESIGLIALDQRLGVLEGNHPDAKLLIKCVKDFFRLSYELEILPSLWKYVATPKFNELMSAFDNMTNLMLKYVNQGIEGLEKKEKNTDTNREASVLEKLLAIDRHAAVVMALDMMLAGIDTTSATTTNCIYHLAKNPEKQEKLREEIRKILPTVDSKLTTDSLNSVPYLRACVKEAIRLSPIVNGNMRKAGQNLVLQGYQVPKGTDVAMGNVLLQWEDGHFPDSKKFLPERWLKDEATAGGCPSARLTNPFVYLPFGFGSRSCIGKRFAELEVNIILLRIFRQFNVEWNYPPIKYINTLILVPAGDLKFKLTELKD